MFEKLTRRTSWQPHLKQFLAPLHAYQPYEMQLYQYPKGVDNTHIDVTLSPEFTSRAELLVRRTLLYEISENYWGKAVSAPAASEVQSVQDAYTGMMEVAVDKSRKSVGLWHIQLLQLSIIKFMLLLVTDEIERLRVQMQRARDFGAAQSAGRSVELYERLVVLAKDEPIIRYRLTRRLFKELLKLEDVHLSKLRQSVLGCAWPLPRELLANPMLQIPSLWADEQLMQHYTLGCTDRDDQVAFKKINQLVVGLFEKYLPDSAQPVDPITTPATSIDGDDSGGGGADQREHSVLPGFYEVVTLLSSSMQPAEYENETTTWLDVPENMEHLLFSLPCAGSDIASEKKMDIRWVEFRQQLVDELFRAVSRSGLEDKILACHEASFLYKELNGGVPVRVICQYLEGSIRRRELQRKLASIQPPADQARVLKLLDKAISDFKYMAGSKKKEIGLRFLVDFTVFRRDLKLAYKAYKAINGICLLKNSRDIELSYNNGTLQEFVLRDELKPRKHAIRNHVILKADLRGSTLITQKLRDKNLNPASHFSLNFFRPINKLLPGFGAKKVFVEGDAVILSIFEYADMPFQWLCVSHACGLARAILKVVDAQNMQNRSNNLPELELGMGIVFSNQAPTFLYDEEQEIMISPAINQADRLSSCSAILRSAGFGEKGRGVEVVAVTGKDFIDKVRGDERLRYNVNGIELDTHAFNKLRSELTLTVLEVDEMSDLAEGRYYVGRYPDIQGKMHWLIVREAPVRVWEGETAITGQQYGDRFYQVLTDDRLIGELLRKVSTQDQSGGNGEDGLPSLAGGSATAS
ncbi:MAG: hypothetical protein GY703_09865 [Gammaproteobacteria bacterium]|nr:hypothetical protein [Gammaproteobacteria bacterium]